MRIDTVTDTPEDAPAPTVRNGIREQMRPLLNHIVLVHGSWLGRFVGIHEDAMDLYYHVRLRNQDMRPPHDRRDIYASCVGGCASLSGIDHYDHLEADFTRDGCPPVDEFLDTQATRAENILYGLPMLDERHGACDRVVLSGRDEHDPIWWVLVRGMDGMVAEVEENDLHATIPLVLPEGETWANHLALRVIARGGKLEDARAIIERAEATCSKDERDHPGFSDEETRRAEMGRYGRRSVEA